MSPLSIRNLRSGVKGRGRFAGELWMDGAGLPPDNSGMPKELPVHEKLARLIERSGMSQSEVARQAGFAKGSSIWRYTTPTWSKTRRYFTADVAKKLSKALVGRGIPPITEEDVLELAGIVPSGTLVNEKLTFPSQPQGAGSDNRGREDVKAMLDSYIRAMNEMNQQLGGMRERIARLELEISDLRGRIGTEAISRPRKAR